MKPAHGPVDNSSKFKVDMQYASGMTIGVSCAFQIGTHPKISPGVFYVTPRQVPCGETVTLNATNKVVVWFQKDVTTGTMIGEIDAKKIVVDFTRNKTQTVSFGPDGTWSDGPLSARVV
jgi:hypothetical protein